VLPVAQLYRQNIRLPKENVQEMLPVTPRRSEPQKRSIEREKALLTTQVPNNCANVCGDRDSKEQGLIFHLIIRI
jgi:hypothetical protein